MITLALLLLSVWSGDQVHGQEQDQANELVLVEDDLGNFKCYVGTDYSSNYDEYRDEWYYYYQFWPIGTVESESTKVLGAAVEDRVNLLRRSEGLAVADCGPYFDACKTVVTVITEEVFEPGGDDSTEWKYSKVEHSCAKTDYCYPTSVTTSSHLPAQQGTQKNYETVIDTLCCFEEPECNLQVADDFNSALCAHIALLPALAALFGLIDWAI